MADVSHLVRGAALLVTTLVLLGVVRNGVIKRRLRFTLWAAIAYGVIHFAGMVMPSLQAADSRAQMLAIERLVFMLAVASGGVSLLNPWFREGVPDRLPSILQDTIVLAVFATVATVGFHEQLALTSAVGAAVIGFALQDTLGNAFAGLAIQIDRPFKVGHWVTMGAFEGLVTEITWRATKIRTKAGNLVVVPNNVVSKEAVNNYSEPEAPTRLSVDVGASYSTPPNVTKAAIMAALGQSTRVLDTPQADVVLADFGASALTYRVRFWIDDFSQDDRARDEVRTFIYYEFRRRHIEIPFPIQVEYARKEPAGDPPERRDRVAGLIATVPVLAGLAPDAHRALAVDARTQEYAAGESIVREGRPGESMFIVERGRVDVVIADGRRVATTEAGGYFGEMSLLTGATRAATVTAATDCALIEIGVDAFRDYVQRHPEVVSQLAATAAARQLELEAIRTSVVAATKDASSLLQRMKQFLGL